MTTTKLYLDIRSRNACGECPLKITITKHGRAAQYSLGIRLLPSQWDSVRQRVKDHPNKLRLNNFIQTRKNQFDNLLMELIKKGELAKLTSTQIKNKIASLLTPDNVDKTLFVYRFKEYMSRLNTKSTKEKYQITLKRILQFCPKAESLAFEDITKDWLADFENFLKPFNPSKNGRNIHFRNIRAVFNDAIDNDITTFYPFRKFKIVAEETEKRSLSINELREQFAKEGYFNDLFKLSFFLIGINIADLCHLKEIKNGRISYKRQKTGKLYDIKIEPEALAIINAHRGEEFLLDILDRYKNVHTFTIAFNRNLPFTSYWARHSWATIANNIGIPVDIISRALGHSFSTGAKVTNTYINFDSSLIDAANRKVMDYVLYGR